MGHTQTAICADSGAFGIFMTLTVQAADDARTIRDGLAHLHDMTNAVAQQYQTPDLVSAVGYGADIWPAMFDTPVPEGLVPFAALENGSRQAPSTPADIFIHIHSSRHDVNFQLARQVMASLRGVVAVVEEIHGFRYMGGRDLTGFVDGTENPSGDDRAKVALVADGLYAGGSYVSVQRYVHNTELWDRLSQHQQEMTIGRTKEDDIEIEDDARPASAHISRVVVEEDGEELEILRHSMPYGTTSEHGLYFVAYAASPHPFRRMLERMIHPDSDGPPDHLLDFTKAVSGASFFVPAVD